MKKLLLLLISGLFLTNLNSQNTIQGEFKNREQYNSSSMDFSYKLMAYDGFDTYTIDSALADVNGKFELSFKQEDYGMAYVISEYQKTFMVVLNKNEDLKLKGESLANPERIQILNGPENQCFEQYSIEHPRREQTLSAWDYLKKIYDKDSLFMVHDNPKQAIAKEKKRIKAEDSLFLAKLPKNSYVSWYLPMRKLVSAVPTIAQYRTEEIPATIAAFRNIDYTDPRVYKSGLLADMIDSHFWLIENSGRSLDSVYIEMNKSIDQILDNLAFEETKFNEITQYLFHLLEKRSLYPSSEYLALKVLTQNSCTLNDDLARQMELYRAMKIGNTAPEIQFKGDVIRNAQLIDSVKSLSDIKAKYKLVIFGASWCPQCAKELGQLISIYDKWKNNGVEVLFVSLDTEENLFRGLASILPITSVCDYKKWETQAAKDFYVFATPSLFLVDQDHKILLRPNTIQQMDAWVDYYLINENEIKILDE